MAHEYSRTLLRGFYESGGYSQWFHFVLFPIFPQHSSWETDLEPFKMMGSFWRPLHCLSPLLSWWRDRGLLIFSKRPETKKTLQSYASTVGNVKILLIETNPLWGISYLDLNVRWHHRSWESHLLVSCLQIHSTGKRRLIKGSEVTKRLNQELQVLKAKRVQINQGNSWQRGIKFIWNSSITSMWKSKCWCDVWLYWDFLLNVRNGLNSKQAEPGISSDTGPEKVS